MNYSKTYINELKGVLNNIDLSKLDIFEKIITKKIKENKNIFVCGNGGSASIANHFLCDFNKGVKISSKKKFFPKVISLSNNVEMLTAISNDISFEDIFQFQIENYARKDDLLITFSCSGNSKNIKNVEKFAKKKKISLISFTGFAKKSVTKKNQFNIGIKNYGICEDIFQVIMHALSQSIRKKFFNTKKLKTIIL